MSKKYVFMDESGDLGFDLSKKGTSKFFSMTFLVSDHLNFCDTAIKKLFKTFGSKKAKRLGGVLHAHKMEEKDVLKIFDKMLSLDFKVYTIVIDKRKFYLDVYKNKNYLYASLANKLLDYLENELDITFIASRMHTSKTLIIEFKEFLLQHALTQSKNMDVVIGNATQYKGLQLVDTCSWSIHRKYEHGDNRYYTLFANKIYGEYLVFS